MSPFFMRLILVLFFAVVGFSVAAQEDGVKQSTDATQGKDSGASAANIAAAMALLPACIGPPPNPMACAMMAMALMQAGKDNKHKGDAGATGVTASPDFGIDDSSPGGTPKGKKAARERGGSGLTAGQDRDLEKAKEILAANDFSIDENGTVTNPDGNKIPASAFSNPSGLSDLGLSDSQVDDVKKAQSLAQNAVNQFKQSKESGLAGGGGSGAKVPKLDLPDFDPSQFALKDTPTSLNKQLKGNRFTGFSRSLAGDRIGVAGDDIFDMVHRRYKAKDRARFFLP